MILQRLVERYQKQANSSDSQTTPEGFQKSEIDFLIVIDSAGKFVGLEDMRKSEGKKLRGRTFTLPRAVKRTIKINPNLLWDNAGYVLGVDSKGNATRAKAQQEAFVRQITEVLGDSDDIGIKAIEEFYATKQDLLVTQDSLFTELQAGTGNISFRLQTDLNLICQRPSIVSRLTKRLTNSADNLVQCLVTGQQDAAARLHAPIKGVDGTQKAGGNIVSFNLPAFNSYGKEQGFNAPIGKSAEFAYTTALNGLLARDSRRRIQVGSITTVFWAAQQHPLEDALSDLFGAEVTTKEVEPEGEAIRILYAAPHKGVLPDKDETPFYILGLAPNSARVAVSFWQETTVTELANHIRQYFEDISIIHSSNQPKYLALGNILLSTATLGKIDNILPNLAAQMLKAILTGTPYPYTLLTAIINRLRADHTINYPRVAALKAYLNRQGRYYHQQNQEVTVSLDEQNINIGYRLGRLFAVLERLQERANPNINATIRDRYYGAASATPITVFANLLKLKNHHIAKLENKGEAVNRERLIGQIMAGIDHFPAHLSLTDQGFFAIGYYHQREDFYQKGDKSNPTSQTTDSPTNPNTNSEEGI